MTENIKDGYRVFTDKAGKKYIRLYFEEGEKLEKVSSVTVEFDGEFNDVKQGNLYSYQRLGEEKEKANTAGYEDGYEQGYADGLADKKQEIKKVVLKRLKKAREEGRREGEEKARETMEKAVKEQREKVFEPIKGGGRKEALSSKQKDEIRSWRELGKSYREIEQLMGCGVSHVTIGKVVRGEL